MRRKRTRLWAKMNDYDNNVNFESTSCHLSRSVNDLKYDGDEYMFSFKASFFS
ncbi:hypothetical protein DFA_04464 [Cavenderia fasciculata]|uniref:Uncharacterized protein n=1 Tax=Cavenderia fasciculata TaxID=261658 RepID=F4PPN3_CACFS|nr:uncharacterized protein DFA_04464 [Cavenderia fasciculata]EGG22346.1 hypothetical protein DFA_04464 [Cavenderia fasciculata]|eukprot:XP_004360197.1 hypothetical protein DFA_04464 [Cavenderia fasciculata]